MKVSTLFKGIMLLPLFLFSSLIIAQPDADLPTEDNVILDDLIVDGSACIGQDCVNGESFGFDTIRLKENNLRIKFEDTSASASFPSNDWQLTANDSSNGGANKFSIDDVTGGRTPFTIEASAPSHSLYVDDGGRVGLGTSAPVVEAHVVDGDSPTLRLEQDGSSGFTPQTWDLAGNETNFFIRDVTHSSKLPFRLRPDAPGDSFFLDTDGEIGLGTDNPAYDLHMRRTTGNVQFTMETTASTSNAAQIRMHTDNSNRRIIGGESDGTQQSQIGLEDAGVISFYGSTTTTFSRVTAGSTALTASSSRNLKSNIKTLEVPDLLKRIASVPVTTYNWKEELVGPERSQNEIVGLIAQDFYKVLNTGSDTEINGQDVQMALWMGVQELYKENLDLQDQLDEKEERIDRLEKQMSDLAERFEQIGAINVELESSAAGFLDQNRPNPFNDETQIAYSVPANASSASLQITNISGKLIKEVSITDFGTGVVNLRASSLPQGTYTYSLIIDGKITETKKMILAQR